jgi:ABC-2 type transport system permease protein
MTGLRPLLLKELIESRRTLRLPIVVGLFAFVGILSPLTAKYLPEILKLALGDQMTIPIPTPTAADAVLQLQKNLGQFGALAAIVLAMGAVATEKERGTAAFILTKPASRAAFLAAKLLGLAAVLALATAVGVALAWIYTAVLFAPPSIPGWIAMGCLAWLALLAWASLTFLASTVSRSAAAAAGIGFVALIGVSLISAIPPIGRWLPPGLDGPAQALAAGLPVDGADLASAVVGTTALIAACVGAAWLSFRRQEL